MRIGRRTALILAGLVLLSVSAAGAGEEAPRPRWAGGKIYFVPLGNFPETSLEQLEAYFRHKFGLTIERLPALPFERGVVDYRRQQLIAEELIGLMKRRYPELGNDPKAFLIGITSDDIYIRGYTWRFAFSFRQDGRLAVVSSARMDPTRFGEAPDAALLHARLRKMISKNIGIMYYRLERSGNRRSVLYGPIEGLDDLDRMGEDFEGKYVEIRWANAGAPNVALKETFVRITLPSDLRDAIRRQFRGYHLPGNEDYQGGWAEYYEYSSPERQGAGAPRNPDAEKSRKAPFIALGDFNHDQMPDIALLLVEKKRNNFWKLVVFHGGKTGYRPVIVEGSPEPVEPKASTLDDQSPEKGRDYGPVQNYGIAREPKCSDGRPCLGLYMYESSSFEYIWKNGRYVEINTGD